MARLRGVAKFNGVSTGTSAKTLLQLIAPTNQRIAIVGLSVSFVGISATDPPVLIELLRQTTAGTMTSYTSFVKLDQRRNETLQITGQHTATVEPTAGDIYAGWRVHPQSGLILPEDMLKDVVINGGDRLGLRFTTTTAQTPEISIYFEE